jgi:hypothetical protein
MENEDNNMERRHNNITIRISFRTLESAIQTPQLHIREKYRTEK